MSDSSYEDMQFAAAALRLHVFYSSIQDAENDITTRNQGLTNQRRDKKKEKAIGKAWRGLDKTRIAFVKAASSLLAMAPPEERPGTSEDYQKRIVALAYIKIAGKVAAQIVELRKHKRVWRFVEKNIGPNRSQARQAFNFGYTYFESLLD